METATLLNRTYRSTQLAQSPLAVLSILFAKGRGREEEFGSVVAACKYLPAAAAQ